MKLAIMQPYIFPYIGYFQLIDCVDEFVLYDSVNFIMRGWINRNNILTSGKPHMFSIPLRSKSQNCLIENIEINEHQYSLWRKKFIKTLSHSYSKCVNFSDGMDVVSDVLCHDHKTITDLCEKSLIESCRYLGIKTPITRSSSLGLSYGANIGKADKLIHLCKHKGYSSYVNSPGGKALYDKKYFHERGVELEFLSPSVIEYNQPNTREFVSHLSIIDVIMNNRKEDIPELLNGFSVE